MKKIIIILLMLGLATSVQAKNLKVKNCDSSSIADINWALDFIDSHINEILDDATFIPSKYKDKIKKKWPSTTLRCSTKKRCDGDTGAYHKLGNRFNLCWDQLRDADTTRCGLVGVIMHEKAHAANVPIEKQHNETREYGYVRDVDLVYRFDKVVEDICTKKAIPQTDSSVKIIVRPDGSMTGENIIDSGETSKLDLGQRCSEHTQCVSSQCGKGVCVCDDNKDCGSKSRCIKKIGKNYCVPRGGLIGDFCKKNSDCGIGKCEKKSCVCDKDKHCKDSFGSTDFRCATPGLGFGKNFCQPTSVANGGACTKNSDCTSDKCKKDVCVSK